MAKRGPKPKTPANTRKRAAVIGPWEGFRPSGLNDAATAEYHRLVASLRRVGTLDATDPQLVVAAARAQAMLDRAHDTIEREGMTAEGGHGSPIPHPLLAVVNSLTIRLRGLYHDMGLTAASSKHGNPAKADTPGDDWGDLLTVTG